MQDEVRWLLETIAEEWPSNDLFTDGDVVRIDRAAPKLLETGERKRSTDLSRHAAISADEGDRARAALGTEFDYDVETILDVRIEGHHADAGGTIDSKDDFTRLVRYAQAAIDSERTYPDVHVDVEDEVGVVVYRDARIQNERSLSHEYGDAFRTDFEVLLRGYHQPDK